MYAWGHSITMTTDLDNDSKPDLRKREREKHHRRVRSWASKSSGGSFGAPFEVGTSTLTEKIVEWFKQRGFFGVETSERVGPLNQRNKYSAHGASRFTGTLTPIDKPNDES
jgi:hypothetical protein